MANKQPSGLTQTILLAWLLVGTLDMTAACINGYFSFGLMPTFIFKYIATSFYGRPALAGGLQMEIIGIALHYWVALVWTLFFFALYSKSKLMAKSKIATGIIYGLVIWVVMNLLIVPLTDVPKAKQFNPLQAGINAAILIVVIAIPLAFIAGNFYSKNKAIR